MIKKLSILLFLIGGFAFNATGGHHVAASGALSFNETFDCTTFLSGDTHCCVPKALDTYNTEEANCKGLNGDICGSSSHDSGKNCTIKPKARHADIKENIRKENCPPMKAKLDKKGLGLVPACKKFTNIEQCVKKAGCKSGSDDDDEDEESSEACKSHNKEVIDEEKEIYKGFNDRERELTDDISKLEDDIVGKQSKSATDDAEYAEKRADLQNETDRDKQKLEADLKRAKAALDRRTSEQIAAIQKEIDEGLKLRHGIENAIIGANKRKRNQVQGVIQSCRREAAKRLANYRAKRRAAVKKGLNKTSAVSMLQKNRISLSSKDDTRFKKYYSRCWRESKVMRSEIEKSYKQGLNIINQKKKEAFHSLNRARQKAVKLNQEALAGKKQLISEYTKNVQSRLDKFNRDHQAQTKAYMGKKQSNTNEILKIQQDIAKKKGSLRQKRHTYLESKALVAKMRGDNKRNDMYSKVSEYAVAYREAQRFCPDLLVDQDTAKAVSEHFDVGIGSL